jgi:hypothetical protein
MAFLVSSILNNFNHLQRVFNVVSGTARVNLDDREKLLT